jgi:T4 gene Gp59 loader of gp41 DNA helicase C-term
MLSPYQVYCTWLALHTHFTRMNPFGQKSYNFVASNGKTLTTQEAFERHSEHKMFKVAKFNDVRDFLVAYLSFVSINKGKRPRIGDLIEWKENESRPIRKWQGKIESLNHTLKIDLMKLSKYSINELLYPTDKKYPLIVKMWLKGTVSIETLVLLNGAYNIFAVWDKLYLGTQYADIYTEHKKLWVAYSYFLNIDVDKIKEVYSYWLSMR